CGNLLHQGCLWWPLKVHERLSTKFHTFATRKASTENRWYQRIFHWVLSSWKSTSRSSIPKPRSKNFFASTKTAWLTTKPLAPTRPKRTNCRALALERAKRPSGVGFAAVRGCG